jgi:hypothetical protein
MTQNSQKIVLFKGMALEGTIAVFAVKEYKYEKLLRQNGPKENSGDKKKSPEFSFKSAVTGFVSPS